jgi:hypothetical protein
MALVVRRLEPDGGEDSGPVGDVVGAAFGFPAVLFTFALIVVAGYWVLVIAGGLGVDALDSDGGGDASDEGLSGALGAIGLGGAPASVVLSVLIALAWFGSFSGSAVLLESGLDSFLADVGVLTAAIVVAWFATKLLMRPLRRFFPEEQVASRADFLGQVCVIRTGRVDATFGQAEVTADDGSSALVQVRQTGEYELSAGTNALIYDYDADGEFFFVMPFSAAHPMG